MKTPTRHASVVRNIKMKINYELTGTGWADGYIELESQKVHFGVSYMRDALGNLTDSILYLIDNFGQEMEVHNIDNNTVIKEKDSKQSITWEGEPWGHIWDLQLGNDLTIHVSFKTFENLGNEDSLKNEESLQGALRFQDFVKAVVDMLETVLRANGFVGYKTIWHSHEFPIGNFLKLKEFLDNDGISAMTSDTDDFAEDDLEKIIAGFETKTNLTEEIEILKNTAHNKG